MAPTAVPAASISCLSKLQCGEIIGATSPVILDSTVTVREACMVLAKHQITSAPVFNAAEYGGTNQIALIFACTVTHSMGSLTFRIWLGSFSRSWITPPVSIWRRSLHWIFFSKIGPFRMCRPEWLHVSKYQFERDLIFLRNVQQKPVCTCKIDGFSFVHPTKACRWSPSYTNRWYGGVFDFSVRFTDGVFTENFLASFHNPMSQTSSTKIANSLVQFWAKR
jgi:hypothetical protein